MAPDVIRVRLRFLHGGESTVVLDRDEVIGAGVVALVQHEQGGAVARAYFVYESHPAFRSVPVFVQVQAVTVTDPRFDP